MAKIKTREAVKGTIKTIDKAAAASERMKAAYVKTKDRAEAGMYAQEASADEYAADRVQSAEDQLVQKGIHTVHQAGQKGIESVRNNAGKAKDSIQTFQRKRAEKAWHVHSEALPSVPSPSPSGYRTGKMPVENQNSAEAGTASRTNPVIREPVKLPSGSGQNSRKMSEGISAGKWKSPSIRAVPESDRTIRQTAHSSGRQTAKAAEKTGIKTTGKSVKTAEQTGRASIKTSQQAAKAAAKTAEVSIKNSKRAAQAARQASKAAVRGIRAAVKAVIATVKGILAGVKALYAAIAAGVWAAVVIIVVICLAALLAGSVFGIFFSGEKGGDGNEPAMKEIVQEINGEFEDRLTEIKSQVSHDLVEQSGRKADWKEVLAIYAVKVNTDPENPQEVATMDSIKKQLLLEIFWEMNEISYCTVTDGNTEDSQSSEGTEENPVLPEEGQGRTTLQITISHRTAAEMAEQYGFNSEQGALLTELLREENAPLWAAVLYGIGTADSDIVSVALTQVGNVGGEPYWSWYGFPSRIEWCACFVSWCADQCGYIDAGLIPKYSWCVSGVQWFRDRGQWMDGSEEPLPGMIIFFDWDLPNGFTGPQDGKPDHTGIVEKVEGGRVYTIEGNSGDSCREKSYPIGYYEILGYGTPAY